MLLKEESSTAILSRRDFLTLRNSTLGSSSDLMINHQTCFDYKDHLDIVYPIMFTSVSPAKSYVHRPLLKRRRSIIINHFKSYTMQRKPEGKRATILWYTNTTLATLRLCPERLYLELYHCVLPFCNGGVPEIALPPFSLSSLRVVLSWKCEHVLEAVSASGRLLVVVQCFL